MKANRFLLGLAFAGLLTCQASAQVPTLKPTYWASIYNLAAPATAKDIACLENPNGVTVRLLGVAMYGVGASAGTIQVTVVRRSSLNAVGTSTTVTPDSSDPSALPSQITFRTWTTAPATLGTLAGTFRTLRWDITTNGNNPDATGETMLNFSPLASVGFVPMLRNPNSAFCVNFVGSDAATVTMDWVWAEGN